ncbi:hypothetical protein CYMTET_10364 [Cymbomonas tetramitiformis]|uniref:Uncharacterized protein n=1 Tax=Cymbomonas tetramitiformis TaxID=36881 RepID=A0AAE0GPC5_9CHLO|nr:hypothetical protein CYMTET_10364 [Cymbomonas tetramitiformis]
MKQFTRKLEENPFPIRGKRLSRALQPVRSATGRMHEELEGGEEELIALCSHRDAGVVEYKEVAQLLVLGHESLAKSSYHAGKNDVHVLLVTMEALVLQTETLVGDKLGGLLVVPGADQSPDSRHERRRGSRCRSGTVAVGVPGVAA